MKQWTAGPTPLSPAAPRGNTLLAALARLWQFIRTNDLTGLDGTTL